MWASSVPTCRFAVDDPRLGLAPQSGGKALSTNISLSRVWQGILDWTLSSVENQLLSDSAQQLKMTIVFVATFGLR